MLLFDKCSNVEFTRLWKDGFISEARKEKIWVEILRANGIKGAYRKDGHVNLKAKEIGVSFPIFNDWVDVGDNIALGDWDHFEVVEITEIISKLFFLKYYKYKENDDYYVITIPIVKKAKGSI